MQDLINKIGIDKMAHLGIGGLLCGMITVFLMFQDGVIGWRPLLYSLIGWLFVFVVSVFKEGFVDSKFDWWDIIYAMFGCALFTLAAAGGVGMYVLSH